MNLNLKGLGGHSINGPAGNACVTVPKPVPKETTPKTTDADVLKCFKIVHLLISLHY